MSDKQSEASPAGEPDASGYEHQHHQQQQHQYQQQQQQQAHEPNEASLWPKITLFGDSITQLAWDPDNGGWAGHVAHKVSTYFDVDTRGFYGYNTNWARDLLARQFPRVYLKQVEIFVMFFGHNDSWQRKQPVSLTIQQFEQNLRAIIAYLNQHGLDTKEKMILVTPSWYDSATANKDQSKPANEFLVKDREHSARYAETTMRVAREHDITCLDFWARTVDHPNLASLFTDGVHFSRLGAKLYFDSLWPLIEAKIERRFGSRAEHLFHEVYYDQHPEYLAHFRGTREAAGAANQSNEAEAARSPPEPVSSGSGNCSGASKVRDRACRESKEAEPSCSTKETPHPQPQQHQQQQSPQQPQQQPQRVESTVEAADSPTKPSPGKKTRTERPDNPDEPSSSRLTRSAHKK